MKALIASIALVSLAGCSTYAVPRYSVSAETVAALRAIGDVEVQVGALDTIPGGSAGYTEIMCRGVGPIKTPDGETYAEYIRNALISELILADIYQKDAPISLAGKVTAIDFDSASGQWNVAMTLTSSNGKSLSEAETYNYQTSFYGETACNQTAQAGLGAVQNLIKKMVTNPQFEQLLTP